MRIAAGESTSSTLALPLQSAERVRLTLLDPLRVLASFWVVHHHVRAGEDLFGVGFGLFLFLTMLFALASSSRKKEGLAWFARRKASYLLFPWLRWSALYVLLFAMKDLLRGIDPTDRLRPAMAFYGGDPVLWFLPFAAVAVVAARAIQRNLDRLPVAWTVTVASLAGVLGTGFVALFLERSEFSFPARSWVRVAPFLAWGLAVGQTLRTRSASERRELLLLIALVAALGWRFAPSTFEDLPRRTLCAVALTCAGFAWRPRLPGFVRELGTVTFGVYVAHPLVNIVLDRLVGWSVWPSALHAAGAWGAAALLILVLRRAGLRWSECARPAGPPAGPQLLDALPLRTENDALARRDRPSSRKAS